MFSFECLDHDLFGNQSIGSTHILLGDLLSAADGEKFVRNVFSHGHMTIGHG